MGTHTTRTVHQSVTAGDAFRRYLDDQERELVEHHGIEPVSAEHRGGSIASQFRVWFGANAAAPALFLGFLAPLISGLSFLWCLLAIVLGSALGAVAVAAPAATGPRTGLVQILYSRFVFGYIPGRVLGFFNALYCYAWSAVNLVTGAGAIQLALFLAGVGLISMGKTSYALCVLAIAVLQVTASAVGYSFVHRWEKYSTGVMILVFGALSLAVLPHASIGSVGPSQGVAGFLGVVLLAFGFTISWAPYASDYARKLPADTSRRAVFRSVFLGLTISTVWVEALGALLATSAAGAVPNGTPFTAIEALFGNNPVVIGALALIGLSTASNNVPNDYTGGLSLQAAGLRVRRIPATIAGGALATLGAIVFLQSFASTFQAFLLIMSYWVGPWVLIVLYLYVTRPWLFVPAEWDNRRFLRRSPFPATTFLLALVAAWLGMIPTDPSVDFHVLGQGLIGKAAGVDLGFVLAMATTLVLLVGRDVVTFFRTSEKDVPLA